MTRLPNRALHRAAAWAGLGLAVLALGACQDMDPYRRPGMWQPTGAVQANLAAMAANPNDLIRGHGSDAGTPAAQAVMPIDRIMIDHPKPLPDASSESTGDGSSGGGSGSGSGGAGGGVAGASGGSS